ncbi:MAG: hypothetical protein ACJAUZ_001778, partial [Flavobacteriaceae bacterium]
RRVLSGAGVSNDSSLPYNSSEEDSEHFGMG